MQNNFNRNLNNEMLKAFTTRRFDLFYLQQLTSQEDGFMAVETSSTNALKDATKHAKIKQHLSK